MNRKVNTKQKAAKSVMQVTGQAERMTDAELSFWRACFREALADCLSIKRTPEFCAQIAGEVADASIRELRRRVNGNN
jgi:hypothetical protein